MQPLANAGKAMLPQLASTQSYALPACTFFSDWAAHDPLLTTSTHGTGQTAKPSPSASGMKSLAGENLN
jgi:hypothetical protein